MTSLYLSCLYFSLGSGPYPTWQRDVVPGPVPVGPPQHDLAADRQEADPEHGLR
jgi:hypothetical protein